MHALFHLIAATTPPTTTPGSKKGGRSAFTFLFIIILFAGAYFFLIRPRQQRMRQRANETKPGIEVGSEVMSAGGIFGTVVAMDANVVEVQVAPGVVLNFIPRAINLKPGTSSAAIATGGPDPVPHVDEEWDIGPAAMGESGEGYSAGGPDPVDDAPHGDRPQSDRPESDH
jgi:preprotein translocase subunit YajC